MSAEMEAWLESGKPALIAGKRLQPMMNAITRAPLAVKRGQASAFFLKADDGSSWILKKFTDGRDPGRPYLAAVRNVLPPHQSFRSGLDRTVLSRADVTRKWGCFYERRLARWLDGVVMMPRVVGMDWASVADEVRDGDRELRHDQRLTLCRTLSELVRLLEERACAHRDFSCGNVFVEPEMLELSLIDFDSVYHPSLSMPATTTCGTEGYLAPFVGSNGDVDVQATWNGHADRFALAVLSVEFLTLDKEAPLGADGGMFSQDELSAGRGRAVDGAMRKLDREYPQVRGLFELALRARSFQDCPSPQEWIDACAAVHVATSAPPAPEAGFFATVLRRRITRPRASSSRPISLPANAWN